MGDVTVSCNPEKDGDERDMIRFHKVLHVPELGANLVAINLESKKGNAYTGNAGGLRVKFDDGEMFFRYFGILGVAEG